MSSVLESPEVDMLPAERGRAETAGVEMYRWSLEQYQQMVEAGILGSEDRVELLEGVIVAKTTNNPAHSEVIEQLSERLIKLNLDDWSARIQLPIQSERSQPEPDLALVRKDRVRGRHPTGADTLLVIEVADSSLCIDREKSGIYARAGVPNYWIINIPDQRVETYGRLNSSTGEYEALLILHEGESLKLEFHSAVLFELPVRDLLATA